MLFSIIIVNYRTPELAAAGLRSIFKHCAGDSYEIIVIDNNSADGSVELLEKEFGSKIKLIKNSQNLGFARANNQGARVAGGEHLLFLNSDTLLTADILTPAAKLFFADESIGIISPRLLSPSGTPQNGAYGKFPTLAGLIAQTNKREMPIADGAKILGIDWVSGCALMIRHDLFKKIGGWDEKFFLYFEDVDLCRRVWQENKKVIVDLRLSLIHFGGRSLKKNNDRRRYYYRAQDYYFKKHYGALAAVIMKIIRWPYKIWGLIKRTASAEPNI